VRSYRNEEINQQPGDEQSIVLEGDLNNTVQTVFKWEHGGRNVYITRTFNNWEKQIPMHRSGNVFSYIRKLKRGKHAFKFIVDDEWRFALDQPTVADIEGRINNFIDFSEFTPYGMISNYELNVNKSHFSDNEFL
jgi:5'-AMP-activated protein kinase regulatory beta subunit